MCRFLWATIWPVLIELHYSDPHFCHFFTDWNWTVRHLFLHNFKFCFICVKPPSSWLWFWKAFVLLTHQIFLNILTSAQISPNYERRREKHSPIDSYFPQHFFCALAASCVLYDRTEHSQSFFILFMLKKQAILLTNTTLFSKCALLMASWGVVSTVL